MSDLELKEEKKSKKESEEDKEPKDENESPEDEEDSEEVSNDDEVEKDQKKNKKSSSQKKLNKFKLMQQKIKDFFANPKKRLIFIISLGIILIAAVGLGVYSMSHDKTVVSKPEVKKENETVEVQKFPAVLDGVMTDQESANRHPLGIMVENHPDARPQSGLDKASIVYEAIAEGGITRFLALYGTNEAEKVGPVRSARTYYVD